MHPPWLQNYDPCHNPTLSTLSAALPIVVLLGSIALLKIRIHLAALFGLSVAFVVAVFVYRMPLPLAGAATAFGAAFGLFPIGWLRLNIMFLYGLTVKKGLFDVLRASLATLAPDPRIQVIVIAFCFGAFIEGIAGFGTPVAITSAILIQLGFRPVLASGLALIANTAPVAFGSLGIPITTLEQVTGLDALRVSAMVGRQLPVFSVFIPFWVVAAFAGIRGALGVWPAALTAGVAFAVPQFVVSNFHGPWLVDIFSAICSISALAVLLQFWRPSDNRYCAGRHGVTTVGRAPEPPAPTGTATPTIAAAAAPTLTRAQILRAWSPWMIFCLLISLWGVPQFKKQLDRLSPAKVPVPLLHHAVQRVPPVATVSAMAEPAEFGLNFLSATGTGILLAALIAGAFMGFTAKQMARTYIETLWRVRFSLLTIAAMLAIGNVTKYSGTDATLGLALARTGWLYPFFGTLLGWLGVALTGSDTASNVLFGSLQRITAEQMGLSPWLMAAANSSGGVMGKMIDAQSIVVASTATNAYGQESRILRFVFFHSLVLAALMGLWVLLQAYVPPFRLLTVR